MDKENWNKTDSREGLRKLFYQHYYDFIRQWKVVKEGLENIITSYYQIKNVFIAQYSTTCGSKDDMK